MSNAAMSLLRLLSRKKDTTQIDVLATSLKRCLTTFDITLLGIGHMMGSGIYVVSPSTAKDHTGPAIIVAYLIAGLASLLAALAYADFGVRYPRSGSAYSYVYYSIGEFWAFYVGWNVVLENVLSTAACASACSSYIDALTGHKISLAFESVTGKLPSGIWAERPDLLALLLLVAFVVFMTFGVKSTSSLTNSLVCVNMLVLTVVIGLGIRYADIQNWKYQPDNANFNASSSSFVNGFLPYGWQGVFRASASCFFAFVGFDAIAAAGEEALNPQRSLPIATMTSMAVVTTVYVLVSGLMTLMIYFADLDRTSGLTEALAYHGVYWAQYFVTIGAVAGMSTVILATIFSMTRVAYTMAEDGLIYRVFSIVNKRTQIPIFSMYFFTGLSAVIACLLDIETIIEMLSIGTLMAYLIVACALLVSKYSPPEATMLALKPAASFAEVTTLPKLDQVNLAADGFQQSAATSTNAAYSLKPQFAFVARSLPKNYNQRTLVIGVLVFLITATLVACVMIPVTQSNFCPLAWVVITVCVVTVIICTLLLCAHNVANNEISSRNQFNMPLLPILPICSIVINTGLMATLHPLTWLRLLVWISIGFVIYFTHGIRHSKLNKARS